MRRRFEQVQRPFVPQFDFRESIVSHWMMKITRHPRLKQSDVEMRNLHYKKCVLTRNTQRYELPPIYLQFCGDLA